jgi:hypothetical protein
MSGGESDEARGPEPAGRDRPPGGMTCPLCKGTGQAGGRPCPLCAGTGKLPDVAEDVDDADDTAEMEVPPGDDG